GVVDRPVIVGRWRRVADELGDLTANALKQFGRNPVRRSKRGCFTFQNSPDVEDLDVVLNVEGTDGERPARLADKQSGSRQPIERLAERRARYSQHFRQPALLKNRPGGQLLLVDHLDQRAVHLTCNALVLGGRTNL